VPDTINRLLEKINSSPLTQKTPLSSLLLRNEINIDFLVDHQLCYLPEELNHDIIREEAEIRIKYQSYIGREQEVSERLQRLENIRLRPDFDYLKLQSLSYEAREKLSRIKPDNIGQASRIPGISPSDINVLIVFLKK